MKNALNDENLKIKLEQTGFFKNDEKTTIVMPDKTIVRTLDEKSVLEGKVADIVGMLAGIIINSTKYRDEISK